MAELLRGFAELRPDTAALGDETGELAWPALDERVNRWAAVLRGQGLGLGDRLAMVTGNGRDTFAAVLACLHTGIVAVPVNRQLTAEEIGYLLRDCEAKGVLADPACAPATAEAVRRTGVAPAARLVTGAGETAGFAAAEPLLSTVDDKEPEDQRCGGVLLYTSGSTGAAKGVVNGLFTLGAPLARVAALVDRLGSRLGFAGAGPALLVGPWHHSAQLFFSMFPLLAGNRLILRQRFSPSDTLRAIEAERVGSCHLVPTQFVRLLRLPEPERARFSPKCLTRVWHGGGPCPVEVKRRMIDWWGPVFTEYYAATEGGIATLIDSETWLGKPGSVGKPIPPNELLVADPAGRPLPPGEPGRIYLRRPAEQDFRYHNAPEKTAAAHLEPGVFTYGDEGFLDEDGFLFLTGRSSEKIVTGGVNVYPSEIEAVLLRHPAVADAAVLGVPDEEFGERLLALVQAEPGREDEVPEALDRHCRAHLAGFKVPRRFRLVDSIPREQTGKLRRARLTDRYTRDAGHPLADPAGFAHGVPHAEFARLRRDLPVAWVEEPARAGRPAGSGFWALTRHADVAAASRAPETFSSAARGAFLADPSTPEQLERTRRLLVNMDAPEHSRARKLVSAAFGPRAVRAVRESVRRNADRIVREALTREEFDGVRDLAAELPLVVLADLLGIPRADRHLLYRWSNGLVGFDDPEFGGGDVDVYRATFSEAIRYALEVAEEKRRNPADDVVSLLVTSEVDGRRLTEQEYGQFWMLLVVAGNETTRHALSGGLQALFEHPAERDRLAADEKLVPAATEEILRWTTPIMQFRRTATRDVTVAGQPIPGGDKVVLYYVSANRDETVFAEPGRFDVGRSPNPHLAFGVGPHFCLGAALARLEIATVLELLRPRLRELRPAGPAARLESNFMNGIKSLPIRLGRGRAG
ncbi:cytochrome P450 [Amycolatopsis sp. NPDC004079]|uniref:cytochrome P450 n=1 Tax=Amycolatopsis sp. NPDC004079 TaxID=3154549 RepID=UPI0033A760D7